MFQLSMVRGEAKVWQFAVTENGSPVNLTGASIRFVIRDSFPAASVTDDSAALLTKSVGSGISITDPLNGIFELALAKADTNAWEIATPAASAISGLGYQPSKMYICGLKYIPQGQTDSRAIDNGTLFMVADVVRGL